MDGLSLLLCLFKDIPYPWVHLHIRFPGGWHIRPLEEPVNLLGVPTAATSTFELNYVHLLERGVMLRLVWTPSGHILWWCVSEWVTLEDDWLQLSSSWSRSRLPLLWTRSGKSVRSWKTLFIIYNYELNHKMFNMVFLFLSSFIIFSFDLNIIK